MGGGQRSGGQKTDGQELLLAWIRQALGGGFQGGSAAPLGYNPPQYKAPVIGIATRLIQESFACICALALAA